MFRRTYLTLAISIAIASILYHLGFPSSTNIFTNIITDSNTTMSPNPILLILGSGPRVGTSVAKAFASKGYTIVLASRSGTNAKTTEGYHSLQADLSEPASIPGLFATVQKAAGGPPSVVVCNAGSFTAPPDKDSVLSIPAENLIRDFNVNTISPYIAAYEAAKAWDAVGGEHKKTFIYTGNILNTVVLPIPMLTDAGMGKAATAYWIGVADANFAGKGYRYVGVRVC